MHYSFFKLIYGYKCFVTHLKACVLLILPCEIIDMHIITCMKKKIPSGRFLISGSNCDEHLDTVIDIWDKSFNE